jgi:hypothetical protein
MTTFSIYQSHERGEHTLYTFYETPLFSINTQSACFVILPLYPFMTPFELVSTLEAIVFLW